MLSLRAETAEAQAPGACAQQQERPMREAHAPLLGSCSCSAQLEKAHANQLRPGTAKTK